MFDKHDNKVLEARVLALENEATQVIHTIHIMTENILKMSAILVTLSARISQVGDKYSGEGHSAN